jgi:hypothetical protein
MPARHRHYNSTERRKLFTITLESCSRSAGIRVHDALETVITMSRNMQLGQKFRVAPQRQAFLIIGLAHFHTGYSVPLALAAFIHSVNTRSRVTLSVERNETIPRVTGGVASYLVSLVIGCLLEVVADLARLGVHYIHTAVPFALLDWVLFNDFAGAVFLPSSFWPL